MASRGGSLRHGKLAIITAVATALVVACGRAGRPASDADSNTRTDPVSPAEEVDTFPPPTADGGSFSYGCDREYRFVARTRKGGASVELILPDTSILLPRVVSASGARFSDGAFSYWSKGDEALLETPQRAYSGCVSDEGGPGWREARERGVDYRAIGQEPGWTLDLHEGDSIALVTDYGQARYRFPPVRPEVDQGNGRTVYRIETETHRATIVIRDEPCRDAMSGWPYETTVSLTLDGRELEGCGRRL